MRLHDSDDGGKTEPSSLAFRRIERIEDFFERGFVDAVPRVARLDHHMWSRTCGKRDESPKVAVGQFDDSGRHVHLASFHANGLGAVQDHVHNHLLQLRHVGCNHRQTVGQVEAQANVSRDVGLE